MQVLPVVPWSIARIIAGLDAIPAPGADGAAEVEQLAAAVEEAAERPVVARCSSGSSISFTRWPARTASTVIPISIPKPSANGSSSRRSAARIARWPEIGASASEAAEPPDRSRA